MMRLDERKWKTFHISNLFTVKRPAARNKDDYKEPRLLQCKCLVIVLVSIHDRQHDVRHSIRHSCR